MASEFTIERHDRGNVAVLRVKGRLDAKSAQQLMSACHEARDSGQSSVILNLEDITFVASSGVGTLLALTEEYRESKGGIHLVCLPEAVTSVVELLNLGQFLSIRDSEERAMEAIGA